MTTFWKNTAIAASLGGIVLIALLGWVQRIISLIAVNADQLAT